MAATSQSLIDLAKCLDCQIPDGMKPAVMVALLAELTGVTDAQTLIDNARCYDCQIAPGMMPAIIAERLDALVSGGGVGGSGLTCSPSSDPSGVPSGSCGQWVRLDNGKVWFYNSGTGNWDQYLG